MLRGYFTKYGTCMALGCVGALLNTHLLRMPLLKSTACALHAPPGKHNVLSLSKLVEQTLIHLEQPCCCLEQNKMIWRLLHAFEKECAFMSLSPDHVFQRHNGSARCKTLKKNSTHCI